MSLSLKMGINQGRLESPFGRALLSEDLGGDLLNEWTPNALSGTLSSTDGCLTVCFGRIHRIQWLSSSDGDTGTRLLNNFQ